MNERDKVNLVQEMQGYEEENKMETKELLCMVTPVERPKRKLLFLRSVNATDYFSFCEEKGCEWDDYEKFGYKRAPDTAPFFNFGAEAAKGASIAVPVRKR